MPLPQVPVSTLLTDLSEQQQQLIAGGETWKSVDGDHDYKKTDRHSDSGNTNLVTTATGIGVNKALSDFFSGQLLPFIESFKKYGY